MFSCSYTFHYFMDRRVLTNLLPSICYRDNPAEEERPPMQTEDEVQEMAQKAMMEAMEA